MAEQIDVEFYRAWEGRSGRAFATRPGLIGAAIVLAIAALFVSVLLLREPAVSVGAANGSYEHDCCGTLVLRDGIMSFGTKKSVSYVVGKDDFGPYVLPETFVGTWEDRGFQIDGSRPPLKLRLDRIPTPRAIELHDVRRSYSFERQSFRPRLLR